METKQKIRENGNKDFIYTCGYESRLKKEDERLQVPLLLILSHDRLKRLRTHFCSHRERTRTEILNSIDDLYAFKTWLRFFLKQISKGQMKKLNI